MAFHQQATNIGCTHFKECSGCEFDTTDVVPLYSEAKEFFKANGLDLPLIQMSPTEWRVRAKLPVRNINNRIVIGLYRKGSHNVLAIPSCRVHHPSINTAIQILIQELELCNASIYDEKFHRGDLRYIQCVVTRDSSKVQLSLVLNRKNNGENAFWSSFCSLIFQKYENVFHSIWLNFNTEKTNTIFGKEWLHLLGEQFIWEMICGNEIPFHPGHFGQANLDLFEKMLQDISNWIPEKSSILELYAGVGVIGLSFLKNAEKVVLVEREKTAETTFRSAFERLAIESQEKVSFSVAASDEILIQEDVDTVIVDPPRKGLGEHVLQKIQMSKQIHRLAYISCSFESFQRDMCWLLKHNEWSLNAARAYLFFPGTNHIEIAAHFCRSKL